MKSFTSICLKKNGKTPIYKQLGDALLNLILEGILEPDSKLPPIRKMAESLKINSSTVVNAYRYLETKQAVYSILGSGTYVAPIRTGNTESMAIKKPPRYLVGETSVKYDFTSYLLPDSFFPANHIKDAFNSVIEREKSGLFINNADKPAERIIETSVKRIEKNGIFASKSNCFITDSLSRALEVIAGSIINKGDYVVLEKPVGYSRAGAYAERGAKIIQASIEKDGIDLNIFESLLKLYRPKAAHISTYFQTPVNVCYSIEKKKALLDLCYKYGVIIVEEDLYGDFLSDEKKIFLKSLDYRGQVVYVKSITRACLPWFSAYLCVFPRKYAPNAENMRFLYCSVNNFVHIRILRELFESDGFMEAAKNIVKNHELFYQKNADAIDEHLGDLIEYSRTQTGVAFWIRLKKGNGTQLAQKCAARGVLITPGDIYLGGAGDYFRMCVKLLEKNTLNDGLSILREELTSMAGR